jgi:hypothetical protein
MRNTWKEMIHKHTGDIGRWLLMALSDLRYPWDFATELVRNDLHSARFAHFC